LGALFLNTAIILLLITIEVAAVEVPFSFFKKKIGLK